jgi:hypothetical protein
MVSCRLLTQEKGAYITLEEVIPDARIVSETEGIIEYKGNIYYVGLNDLKQKRHYIESLSLLAFEGPAEIDLRFRRQIIIRNR